MWARQSPASRVHVEKRLPPAVAALEPEEALLPMAHPQVHGTTGPDTSTAGMAITMMAWAVRAYGPTSPPLSLHLSRPRQRPGREYSHCQALSRAAFHPPPPRVGPQFARACCHPAAPPLLDSWPLLCHMPPQVRRPPRPRSQARSTHSLCVRLCCTSAPLGSSLAKVAVSNTTGSSAGD